MKKQIFSLIIAFAVLFSSLLIPVLAEVTSEENSESATIIAEESFSGVTWKIYSDGVLEFSCDGKINSFWSTMWHKKNDMVTTIKMGEGVISNYNNRVIFENFPNLKKVYIPSTFTGENFISGCPSIEEFIVAEGNTAYSTENGNLYYKLSNGYKRLVYYINKEEDTYTFPEGVIGVMGDAFHNSPNIKVINAHKNMTAFNENYLGLPNLEEINVDSENSYYESENGILFFKRKTEIVRMPINHKATTYTIPETVTSIGQSAFEGCVNLTELKMSDSVTDMSVSVFKNASNLESVILSDNIKAIRSSSFSGCSKLSEVNIPSKVTSIDEKAFEKCALLSGALILPEGMSYLGEYSFAETAITSVEIPGTMQNFQGGAFYNCDFLESAVIKEGVTYIHGNIFCYCDNLKNVTLPTTVTDIAEGMFESCINLEEITIPSGTIRKNAFKNCAALKTVNLGSGVTSILSDAFYNCESIKEFTIPSNVTSISKGMLNGCYGLEKITINSSADIPKSAFTYLSDVNTVIINGEIKNIGESAFAGMGIKSIDIPSSVEDFNALALSSCEKLESVKLNEGTSSISGYFDYCRKLKYIYIPDSVTSISEGCFSNCPYLTIVGGINSYAKTYAELNNINFEPVKIKIVSIDQLDRLHDYEMNIGSYIDLPQGNLVATTENGDLITVTVTLSEQMDTSYAHTQEITATVTVPYGYELSEDLKETFTFKIVTVPTFVTDSCGKTKEDNVIWTLQDTVLTISGEGEMADYSLDKGCEAPWSSYSNQITLVVVESGVKNIGSFAFKGLYNTKEIKIGNTVSSIGNSAFSESGVTDITIPLFVTQIPESAFLSCDSLEKITINGKITLIGESAFAGCDKLTTVSFAGTQEEWASVDINQRGNDALKNAAINYKLVSTDSALGIDEKSGTITLDIAIPQNIAKNRENVKIYITLMNGRDCCLIQRFDITDKDTYLNNVGFVASQATTIKVFIWEEGTVLRSLSETEIIQIPKSYK